MKFVNYFAVLAILVSVSKTKNVDTSCINDQKYTAETASPTEFEIATEVEEEFEELTAASHRENGHTWGRWLAELIWGAERVDASTLMETEDEQSEDGDCCCHDADGCLDESTYVIPEYSTEKKRDVKRIVVIVGIVVVALLALAALVALYFIALGKSVDPGNPVVSA